MYLCVKCLTKTITMKRHFLIASLCAGMLCACAPKELKLNENNIDEVVAALTLEEKATLCIGVGMDLFGMSDDNPVIGNTPDCAVPGAAGVTQAIERLGIPSIVLTDGPAGVRINPTREGDENTYYCTHFPIGTLLASTWDQELVEHVGQAMGDEVKEYGTDVLLGPALNIHRNPLCGRNFEYFSEDPFVSGKIAAAYTKGVQSQGVGVSLKHFAANNQELNRMNNNAIVSPRALREIYLKGFEIAVRESDPKTIMTSYNYINGQYTSESVDLLTTILRDEWGFKGLVMTDWNAGADGAKQVYAGNDLLEPGKQSQYDQIVAAVNDGSLPMEILDRNIKRLLQLVVSSPTFKGYAYSNKPDLKSHAQVTRQSATEGMVLLENRGGLPLPESVKKVAVFGNTSYNWIAGGTGSGDVNRAYTVNLMDGLKNAGYITDAIVQKVYETYYQAEKSRLTELRPKGIAGFGFNTNPEEMDILKVNLAQAAQANDVAIITIGRISGEGADRESTNFNLNANELAMVKKVTDAFHAAGKKAVVILNIGGVIESSSWKNIPDAVLCAWQGGQEGGNSVADVISGKANPSGKLTMTWPVKFTDHKSTLNFPVDQKMEGLQLKRSPGDAKFKDGKKDFDYTRYEEGIYVGYRWFNQQNLAVSYPFGYGLSYTTFEYSKPVVEATQDGFTASITVTNTGKVAGKEAVELYVAAPAGGIEKPACELKSFAKTHELKPGESQTLTMTVSAYDLASFNEATLSWETAEGEYTVNFGASIADIRATATYHQAKPASVKCHEVFVLTEDQK